MVGTETLLHSQEKTWIGWKSKSIFSGCCQHLFN